MSDKKLLERFQEVTKKVPYQNHGIMPMEAFALCKFIKDTQTSIIIESGTAFGYSTEILGNMFPEIPITTIDHKQNYGESVQNNTKQRLSYLDNVKCIVADSIKKLPNLIESYQNETIAIFIDGPKGKSAIKLAYRCNDYDNVVFCALHDQMEQKVSTYVPNLDKEFTKKYKFLDDEVNLVKLYEPHYHGKTIGEFFPEGMGITFYPSKNYKFN